MPESQSQAIPDSVYSVVVRYVPVASGGPRHELVTTCDRCGTEDTAHWGANQPYSVRGEFDGPSKTSAWMINHRVECAKR